MSIKTKFMLVGIISLLATILVGLFLFQNSSIIGKEIEKDRIINAIQSDIFKRSILRDDYFLHRTERSIIQLQIISKDLNQLFMQASKVFLSTDEQTSLSLMVDNKKFVDQTFSKIIAEPSPKLEQQLIGQILIKSQDNITIASKLEDTSRNNITESQQRTLFLILIFIFCVSFVTIVALNFIWRSIGKPLIELKEAAIRIASLDFSTTTTTTTTTTTPSNDEMGQLARTFNTMAGKLKESYTLLQNANIAAKNVYEDLLVEKERLAKAKVKDEAILASIGDGMIAVDESGCIISMSNITEKMLGWRQEEIRGKILSEVVPIVDEQGKLLPKASRPIFIALTTGKTITNATTVNPYFYARKDGTNFPVTIAAAPVVLKGKIIGAIDSFRDITKERAIEKMRVDFLSLASHQLRTPLSGVKWLIETIQRGVLGKMTKKQKEYLAKIYQTNERMISLVSDMLNVLRLESGGEITEKQEVSISKFYEELLIMMGAAAQSKGVVFRNAFADNRLAVEMNFKLLQSILECFVSNAINYSSSGQEVILDAKEVGAAVVFSVKDSGIGIPKDEQKRIFQRFYRAANAKAIRPDGTGLGLYIASLLAGKIGAKVSFKSAEGKGSTFYLIVPQKAKNIV